MPSRVSASPFINSNSGQETLCCTLPPLPGARFEFEHKTNIQESLTVESVRDAKKELAESVIYSTEYIKKFLGMHLQFTISNQNDFQVIMQ